MITTERLTSTSVTALGEINGLLLQLRRDPSEPLGTQSDLDSIVGGENVIFVVVKDNQKIIGMATLYSITKFGKRTGIVEDVVVDSAYRGQGLGQKLMEKLVEEARSAGLNQLYLTSGNDREAAQKLYQKIGFMKKDTQVFRMVL